MSSTVDFPDSIFHNKGMSIIRQENGTVREPVVDGIFYPSDREDLSAFLSDLFEGLADPPGDAMAIVAPHAGYLYSGRLTATAFQAAAGRRIRTAVILAPLHRDPEEGIILPESELFRTPLGYARVDQDIVERLAQFSPDIHRNDIPHLEEHCIEVQIPFIQHLFPAATIVPVLLGRTSISHIQTLSRALGETLKGHLDEVLLIASANMTSYCDYRKAMEESDLLLDTVMKNDWEGLIELHAERRIGSCGAGCISVLLSMNLPDHRIRIIDRSDSSEANNDRKSVIQYASIAFDRSVR